MYRFSQDGVWNFQINFGMTSMPLPKGSGIVFLAPYLKESLARMLNPF